MREPTREVDVEEFAAHVATGLEAWEFAKHFGHYGPLHEVKDYDPVPAAPQDLPELDPEPDDEPLC